MIPAYNKDPWVSHFTCYSTDYNMLFTHKSKREATKIVRQAWNIIRTRFNAKVVFMRSDGEPALGDDFQEIVRETGITFEHPLLIRLTKRPFRTKGWDSNIVNRTPMAKHRLEMPHELVIGKKLDLSHLHVISPGSKS